MGEFLKNVLLTAVMVVGATLVASVVAGVSMLVIGSLPDEMPDEPGLAAFGIVIMGVVVAAFGVFYCAVTLFFAALTMPPALLLARWLNLPRPMVDILGGGAVGLLCGMIGIDIFDSDKFAGMVAGANAQIIATTALVVGCLLGYVRHMALVRKGAPNMVASIPA